jgi:hypothetical protein
VLGARSVRKIGSVSFDCLLGTLGLALVVVEDRDALARVRPRLAKRKLKRALKPLSAAPSAA